MPWIQNVAKSDIAKGFHINPGENAMLIQIVDPPGDFPNPKHTFKEVHQFQFLDIEEHDFALDEEMRCSQEQANQLVALLQHALANQMNVIVHCIAGLCRSGAVTEVGLMLGFEGGKNPRMPNAYVKRELMKKLGLAPTELEYRGIFQ
jgi:protein-tyrosine phosphatase